jgi:hypothetical protein
MKEFENGMEERGYYYAKGAFRAICGSVFGIALWLSATSCALVAVAIMLK